MQKINVIAGTQRKEASTELLSLDQGAQVQNYHKSLKQYQETPLVSLEHLAAFLGVKAVYVKDESYRFGLHAFKGLGGSYAISKILEKHIGPKQDVLFVTATDGNHGKGVAWAAANAGCKAAVFMPKGSELCRAEAIGAINETYVEITESNYADTVRIADQYAKAHGGYLVQDMGFDDYIEIPDYIVQGYMTMASEAVAQLEKESVVPTHVILQAGVGAMAGGVLGYLANYYKENLPVTLIAEPTDVACIYESVRQGTGAPCIIGGNPETIMAGLNCGEPNPSTWPILRDYAAFYTQCPDWVTEEGMRILGCPSGNDPKVVSGESGAVGVGLLAALCLDPAYQAEKEKIGLHSNSIVLLFSTEGDTDPEHYQEVLATKSIYIK